LVEQLSAYGIPQADICAMIINPESGRKIDEQTLADNFRHELDTGTTKANARVAGALYKNAVDSNNVAAQIFWLKTRARWKEAPTELRHGGSDEAPAMKMELTHHVVDAGTAARAAQILAATGIGFDSKDSGGTD
jgi:hypothetical protein